ncbi:MAG: protein translocase subunit SecD [Spirochaetes bacterium]|nr:protein translocase subunit SecD [Spirochaetota bacterium]
MSKRYRLAILLLVLGVCFAFLMPTLRWHFFTSRDAQALAMASREYIRTYASMAAHDDLNRLVEAARVGGDVPEDLAFMVRIARGQVRRQDRPDNWDAFAVLNTFQTRGEALEAIESRYRDEIFGLKALQNSAVSLGLDISGGLSILLQANFDSLQQRLGRPLTDFDRTEAMNSALVALNSRIDQFGLTEPVIRRMGADQIIVEIPGTSDPERINDIIMGRGALAFHLEDSEATFLFNMHYRANPTTTFDANGNLINPDIVPPHVMILGQYTTDNYGLFEQVRDFDGTRQFVAVMREVGLSGYPYILDASVERNPMDRRPEVTFMLSSEGGEIFHRLTSANVNETLTIVLDGRVRSRATITSPIRYAVRLTGFDMEEAQNISLILRTAALPVELEVASQQSIGASLGEETIRQGLFALLGGIAAVFAFMLIYYKSAGINAVIAQLLNFYIMFSILSAFGFTLTLPAIAGFILTIGMATDANVIIFERIKDELRLGKSRKAAIELGFERAFWTIMDSNITTFIAALFLSQLGSGPIAGFALTLCIGVFSSVFTSLFVSRLLFDFNTDVLGSKTIAISWTKLHVEGEVVKGTA